MEVYFKSIIKLPTSDQILYILVYTTIAFVLYQKASAEESLS